MDLEELAPVGWRPAVGRHRRRFERFTQAGEDLADGLWVGDEGMSNVEQAQNSGPNSIAGVTGVLFRLQLQAAF